MLVAQEFKPLKFDYSDEEYSPTDENVFFTPSEDGVWREVLRIKTPINRPLVDEGVVLLGKLYCVIQVVTDVVDETAYFYLEEVKPSNPGGDYD